MVVDGLRSVLNAYVYCSSCWPQFVGLGRTDDLRCHIGIIARSLGQAIGNIVIRPLVGAKDVSGQAHPRITVNGAGKNRQMTARPVPKKVGPTCRTKPAPRRWAGTIPLYPAADLHLITRGRCCRDMVTRGLAALRAMAGDHRAHRARCFVLDGPTQTASRNH